MRGGQKRETSDWLKQESSKASVINFWLQRLCFGDSVSSWDQKWHKTYDQMQARTLFTMAATSQSQVPPLVTPCFIVYFNVNSLKELEWCLETSGGHHKLYWGDKSRWNSVILSTDTPGLLSTVGVPAPRRPLERMQHLLPWLTQKRRSPNSHYFCWFWFLSEGKCCFKFCSNYLLDSAFWNGEASGSVRGSEQSVSVSFFFNGD